MKPIFCKPIVLFALVVASTQAQQPTTAKSGDASSAKSPAGSPDPQVEQALDLFKQQKVSDAIDLLKRAGKSNPLLPPAKVLIAQWAFQAGNGQAARLFLEQAISDDPTHADPYLLNASFALGEGRVTDAVLSLQEVERLTRATRWDAEQRKRFVRETRVGLATCYLTRGDFAAAKEQFKGLLNEDPKNAQLRQRLAEAVFRAGQPEEAFDELNRAYADDTTIDPPELRMAAFWQTKANGEGDLQAAANARAKAEEFMKQAVSKYSRVAKCHREYAVWLMEAGRPSAAVLYLDALEKLEPATRDTTAARALWHLYRKEYSAAEPLLESIMRDSPGDTFATGYLCLALAESGDPKKQKRAVELADTLVKQNPKAPLPYAIAGWCLFKTGRLPEAEKVLGVAASTGQVTFDTAYFLARLFAEQKKYDEAARLLREATAAPHGPFLYRAEAVAFLAELAKKLPQQSDTKKDEVKK